MVWVRVCCPHRSWEGMYFRKAFESALSLQRRHRGLPASFQKLQREPDTKWADVTKSSVSTQQRMNIHLLSTFTAMQGNTEKGVKKSWLLGTSLCTSMFQKDKMPVKKQCIPIISSPVQTQCQRLHWSCRCWLYSSTSIQNTYTHTHTQRYHHLLVQWRLLINVLSEWNQGNSTEYHTFLRLLDIFLAWKAWMPVGRSEGLAVVWGSWMTV